MASQATPKDMALTVLTQYYLRSGGFNGMSAVQLAAALKTTWPSVAESLRELINEDLVGLLGEGTDVDTHMLRIGFPSREMQLSQLERPPSPDTCIYPRPKHLATVVKQEMYTDRPYRLYLALGEPQLAYRVFDLAILEQYRKSRRYRFRNDDIGGQIYLPAEHADAGGEEKSLMKTFGFAYDADLNRAVAVFLRHLAVLPPKHQMIWKERELKGKFELYPDYFRTTALGDPPEGASIFSAFIEEIRLINELARSMGRPELFQEHPGTDGRDRPPEFGFLMRPTLQEYNAFVLLLDKMLSESICRDFFCDDVRSETEKSQLKGPLEMLVDWGSRAFPPSKVDRWLQACRAIRKIRSLRQRPEHAAEDDVFDQAYLKKQRELMISAYKSLRVLREMIARHPEATNARLTIPRWIQNGRIWSV